MNKAPQSIEDFSIPKDVIAKLLEQEPQVSVLTEDYRLLALWSWSRNHPNSTFQEFQGAYYRCERLGSRNASTS